MKLRFFQYIPLLIIYAIYLFSVGCAPETNSIRHEAVTPSSTHQSTSTLTAISPTLTRTSTPSPIPVSASATPTATAIVDLCQQPSDNYERVIINGHHLNARTYEMLEYADSLYSGQIEITGYSITQGSYTNAVDASFGTHAGGGAVDISVMAPGTYIILYEDIEPLIQAMRVAGFAAWFRDFDELYDGSPVHIHAISIGDKELSFAARQQLTGPYGYFSGYNGLPTGDGVPLDDPHGGPIICSWMLDLGYEDLTAPHTTEE